MTITKWVDYFPWRFRSLNNFIKWNPNPFFSGVLSTLPYSTPVEGQTEIHVLACHRDLNMLLLALKSFFFQVIALPVVVHDDGSLTDRDEAIFKTHIPGSRVIRRDDADKAMRPLISANAYEKRKKHVFLLKLFDFNCLSNAQNVIMMDSDIIFVDKAPEIASWLHGEGPRALYNLDITDTFRANNVQETYALPARFNAGFVCFRGRFSPSEVEAACDLLDYWLEDQTIYAYLFRGPQVADSLSEDRYVVYSENKDISKACMIHFISPYRFKGLRYIRLAHRMFACLRGDSRGNSHSGGV